MLRPLLQRHLGRFRRRYVSPSATTSAIALALLALTLILMPVSYKAGASTAHAHTVFQAIIDQVRGETHSHADESTSTGTATQPTLFLALNLPLSAFSNLESPAVAIDLMVRAHHLSHDSGLATIETDSDLPQLTSVHGSSDLATALTMLEAIWALLLLRQPIRQIWFSQRILHGIRDALEGPPPRFLLF